MSIYSIALGQVIQDDDWDEQMARSMLEEPRQVADLLAGDLNSLVYEKRLIPIDREGKGGLFTIGDAAVIAAFLSLEQRENVMEMIRSELVNALAEVV